MDQKIFNISRNNLTPIPYTLYLPFRKSLIMPEFDLQDSTDVDIMRGQFNMISHEEWDEYIAAAESKNMGYKNINILNTARRKAGIAKYLSPKVLNWILNLVEKIDDDYDDEEYEDEDE